MTLDNRLKAVCAVSQETLRQDLLHGRDRDLVPDTWLRLMVEEIGEVAHAIDERDTVGLGVEIAQVGALAVQFLEWMLAHKPISARHSLDRIREMLQEAQVEATQGGSNGRD